jgi:hypothetical protein
MREKDINMRFRDVASVNLLFAALEKEFPHFRSVNSVEPVRGGGNSGREEVFLTLRAFSTNFPQNIVDDKAVIS